VGSLSPGIYDDEVIEQLIKRAPAVTWRVGKRAIYVFFFGRLDATLPSPELLLETTAKTGRRLLVLDLRCADQADSRALEWLEQLYARAEGGGVRVRLVVEQGSRLRNTLDVVRFSRFVLVLGSIREALRAGHVTATP
jgi:anti-anti-sigma regulatory factor